MTLTISLNYGIGNLVPKSVSMATAMLDGKALTSGVQWVVFPEGACILSVEQGKARLTGATPGAFVLGCVANGESAATIGKVLPGAVPVPVPPPVVPPPVAGGDLIRAWLQLWVTDFYYTWGTGQAELDLEKAVALYYDGCISGDPSRHARMQMFNPKLLFIPYTVEYTMIQQGTANASLASVYGADLDAWVKAQGLTTAEAEAMWLHKADGTRVEVTIWGSKRFIGDPRDLNWRRYTIDRYVRLAKASAPVTGLFMDEFGSGGVTPNYKLGAGGSATVLSAIEDSETSLIKAISLAIAPKLLVINNGNYAFQWDTDLAVAAGGVHMEQANNPMSLDWWATNWVNVDKLLAAGVLVNLVCAYNFGEYESTKDANGVHMDSHRGKLLELAAYYMTVLDPKKMALHLNNSWNKAPLADKLAECEFNIGKPLSARTKPGAFFRAFEHGLVLVNGIHNRDAQDYAVTVPVTLPTDRKYGLVDATGKVGPQVTSVQIRCPEAMIFGVIS